MLRRWTCNCCGCSFSEPVQDEWDTGYSVILTAKRCPKCDSSWIEELEPCPTCDAGWRRKTDRVCEKCRLYGIGKLKQFTRSLALPIVQMLDDELEGGCLEDFRD